FQQAQGFVEQQQEIVAAEVVVLVARVQQEVGDDVVQALGFAAHDVHQHLLLVVQGRHFGKHLHRSGNGGERVADFMGDAGGKASDGGETVAQADLIFQPAHVGEIGKGINVPDYVAIVHSERRDREPKDLFATRSPGAQLALYRKVSRFGKRIAKQRRDVGAEHFARSAPEEIQSRLVDQGNAPIEIGGDKAAAHGVQNVVLNRLQVLEFVTLGVQLHAYLAQLRAQAAGEVSDGHEGEKVDADDQLHRLQVRTGNGKRADRTVIRQIQNRAECNERERCCEIRPPSRQQNAGHDNDQRI